MKMYFLTILFTASTLTAFTQEVLFIGLYTKADAGTGYWCRSMEMVKQIAKTEEQAQQLATDFKKEHAKESPVVKLVRKGSVVIFDYQKQDKAFNCTYRVISWKEGRNSEEASQALENDKERIKKEYNGQPNQLYAWSAGPQSGLVVQKIYSLRGVDITFKEVQMEGEMKKMVAIIKNPRTDSAAAVGFIVDGTRTKRDYKLQPGETLTITLGKVKEIEVLVNIKQKGEEKDLGYEITKDARNYMRQKFIINQGKAEPKSGTTWGGRH